MPAYPFGDERRLARALALDHRVPGDLHAVAVELLVLREREARAYARAARHRRGEAHAVEPVVDAHAPVAEGKGHLRQVREQRQREKAVRDGAAEMRGLRAAAIDMDPLEVLDRRDRLVSLRRPRRALRRVAQHFHRRQAPLAFGIAHPGRGIARILDGAGFRVDPAIEIGARRERREEQEEEDYGRQASTPEAIARAIRSRRRGSRSRASSAGLTITPASTSTAGIAALRATVRLS